jgi:hypothetical protein
VGGSVGIRDLARHGEHREWRAFDSGDHVAE